MLVQVTTKIPWIIAKTPLPLKVMPADSYEWGEKLFQFVGVFSWIDLTLIRYDGDWRHIHAVWSVVLTMIKTTHRTLICILLMRSLYFSSLYMAAIRHSGGPGTVLESPHAIGRCKDILDRMWMWLNRLSSSFWGLKRIKSNQGSAHLLKWEHYIPKFKCPNI